MTPPILYPITIPSSHNGVTSPKMKTILLFQCPKSHSRTSSDDSIRNKFGTSNNLTPLECVSNFDSSVKEPINLNHSEISHISGSPCSVFVERKLLQSYKADEFVPNQGIPLDVNNSLSNVFFKPPNNISLSEVSCKSSSPCNVIVSREFPQPYNESEPNEEIIYDINSESQIEDNSNDSTTIIQRQNPKSSKVRDKDYCFYWTCALLTINSETDGAKRCGKEKRYRVHFDNQKKAKIKNCSVLFAPKPYSAKSLPQLPAWQHNKKAIYECKNVTLVDAKKFHDAFYSNKTKQTQDAFLPKFCHVTEVQRRRPRTGTQGTRQANYSTKLIIKKRNSSTLLHVCQSSFLGILQIPRNRIRRVAETFKKTGGLVKENRGGDHTSLKNVYKLQEVKSFIESLQCIESHYCPSTTERKYLDSTLNIKKLWQMYNEQAVNTVKQCYFRRIFTIQYNIGFGNPRTDVCSKCTELEEQIKNEKNESVKAKYMIEKTIHKRKAKFFYQLLNQRQDGMITLSFNCQKNQVLPKLPDQITYYSRQLYIYNFAVVLAVEGKRLNKDTVTLYMWNENEYRKGANEIASGVYHRLKSLDFNGIQTLRLVADGCGAQNKNSIFIGMCCVRLCNAPNNIKNIELVFPIPGHSFLPADQSVW
ncbi:unnamed protein product [Pieris macdunnoughi]|uniref:Uncharacterized protein n=1 Tax=Pieris macdunnoughi TaxID=345717 RepID=A0A821XH25_9NEOP|nr:unnamed protein product [Pieris macdunnoughi]